ncbi:MAG TPA: hypothetical protein VNN72_19975 [Polyangiaceae bacterium]|nr:hypothetical protein [Polyangiaceae bacterium]
MLALLASACGTPPAKPAATPTPVVADTAPRAPLDYVPAAGLRWLCTARPQRIFRDSALRALALSVLDTERLDAFTMLTGIDLRELEAGAIAGYDLGTLYVVALGAPDGGTARARFQERLTNGAQVKQPQLKLYRLLGTRAGEPLALVSVHDRLLAFAAGDPSLARVAEAYAMRRLKSPTALHGAALSVLPEAPSDALAAVYFPGPFTGDWARAAYGVLGSAQALDVTVEAAAPESLHLTLTLVGDFPVGDERSKLERAWTDLQGSSTGQLFGLNQIKKMSIVADLHHLTWSGEVPAAALVAGLRAATIANVPEMFGEHRVEPAGSPVEPAGQPR